MLLREVALWFFLFLFILSGAPAQRENSGEAELFCRIRLLAETDPEKLVYGNEEREKKILRRIVDIGPEIRSLAGVAHPRDASIRARLRVLVKGAKKLVEFIRDLRRKAAEKRVSAKRHLRQVIFGEYGGEGKGELDSSKETIKKIFSSDKFEESCGGSGNKMAGKSLINDFICLCAKWIPLDDEFNPNKDESICKYGVTTAVKKDFSNWTTVWHWNKHRICVNTPPLTPTPESIHYLVALFLRAVKRHHGKSQVQGVFGYVNTTLNNEKVCDGNATAKGGFCVNYEHALKNGGIEWVNHLQNASQDLEDMEQTARKSERVVPQLELLEYNALLLYEEAKYSTHFPHDPHAPKESYKEIYKEMYKESFQNFIDSSEEDSLEELEDEEDTVPDATWKGRPLRCRLLFFFLMDF